MSSWILDYVQAIDPVSESPMQFNIWAAISVVSSVLKKNVYLNYRTFTIYPNQYIILVAPPGVGKGEATKPAHEFPKTLKLVNYMSDRVTAPKIIENLFKGFSSAPQMVNGVCLPGAKDSTATLFSTELPTLLTSSDWMLQFLCDAWDKGEFDYDTKNSGTALVRDMCVSLIGNCVPDYIRKLNKDANAAVSSGFSARTIFVHAKCKSKTLPWGGGFRNDPKAQQIISDLESRITQISQLKGEFTLDPHARILWDDYYIKLDASISEDDSEVFRNFKSRQPIHVLKLAMTLSAAESTSLIITRSLLERSIKLIDNIAEGIDEIFRGVGEATISAALARIELYLERKGEVSYNEMLNDNKRYVDHEDIVKVLNILKIVGFCTESAKGDTTYYKHSGVPIRKVRP